MGTHTQKKYKGNIGGKHYIEMFFNCKINKCVVLIMKFKIYKFQKIVN